MIKGLLFVVASFPTLAFAGAFDGTRISVSASCVSPDGVPISEGTSLATQCCSNGKLVQNPPTVCRVGFSSISADVGAAAAFSMNIAQNTLTTAGSLNGSTTDYGDGAVNTGPLTSAPGSNGTDAGALVGGTGMNTTSPTGTSGTASNGGATGSGSGSGSGSGAGSGGAAGSGSLDFGKGSGSSASNGSKGANGTDSDAANGKGGQLAYVRGGQGGSGKAGGDGGLFNFGGGEKGAGAGSADELKLADGTSADANALANADEDGARGTAEDPADYLSRIDQSANIFKIVSSRYMKKKSLWRVNTQ